MPKQRVTRSLIVLLLCSTACLGSCAHTKPFGQSLVAIGALLVGLGTLDAAGVLGSQCHDTITAAGAMVHSCSGSNIAPQPVNIVGIAIGAGLIGGGAALWASDSSTPPVSNNQTGRGQVFGPELPALHTAAPRATAP